MALVADLWSGAAGHRVRRARRCSGARAASWDRCTARRGRAVRLAPSPDIQPQSWRCVFWVNVPLAFAAVAGRATGRSGQDAGQREWDRRTGTAGLVGGGLLAVALGLLVVGLYNPDPDRAVLPIMGTAGGGGGAVARVGVRAVGTTGHRAAAGSRRTCGGERSSARWGQPGGRCRAAGDPGGHQLFAQTVLADDGGAATAMLVAVPGGAAGRGVGRWGCWRAGSAMRGGQWPGCCWQPAATC